MYRSFVNLWGRIVLCLFIWLFYKRAWEQNGIFMNIDHHMIQVIETVDLATNAALALSFPSFSAPWSPGTKPNTALRLGLGVKRCNKNTRTIVGVEVLLNNVQQLNRTQQLAFMFKLLTAKWGWHGFKIFKPLAPPSSLRPPTSNARSRLWNLAPNRTEVTVDQTMFWNMGSTSRYQITCKQLKI